MNAAERALYEAVPEVFADEPASLPPTTSQATISAGCRNVTLTQFAGTMRKRGMVPAAIEAALLAQNAESCDPPLPPAEVRQIAASIGRYPAGEFSAPPRVGVRAETISFHTAAEITAKEPPAPVFVAAFYLALGVITEIVGKAKVAGKSTFLAHLIGAILFGRPFLGQPTRRAPVVWLTEDAPPRSSKF